MGRKPRVLYLINGFGRGGAELALVRLVEGGLFQGCELRIAGLAGGSPELIDELAALGAPPLNLSGAGRLTPRTMLKGALALAGLLRRERPDVLILSLPQANILGRLLSYAIRPAPLVISFEHNTHLAKPVYEAGFRMTSRRVDWMFADAAHTAQVVAKRLYRRPPRQVDVVPLVAFDEPPGRAPSPAAAARPFTVLNAGRLTAVKNQGLLIQAVAELTAAGTAVRLILCGEGPEEAAFRRLADELGVSERVEFRGFVADWASLQPDAFVLTSRHEGLCIALLEAMHRGIPVVAPPVGGVSDYLTPENGLVLEALEPATLAATLRGLIAEPAAAAARASAAQSMVMARYSRTAALGAYADVNRRLRLAVAQRTAR